MRIAEAVVEGARKTPFKLQNTRRTIKLTFSAGVAHFPHPHARPGEPSWNVPPGPPTRRNATAGTRPRSTNRARTTCWMSATLYPLLPMPSPHCSRRTGAAGGGEHRAAPGKHGLDGAGKGVRGWARPASSAKCASARSPQRVLVLEAVGAAARMGQPFGFLVDAPEQPPVGLSRAGPQPGCRPGPRRTGRDLEAAAGRGTPRGRSRSQ